MNLHNTSYPVSSGPEELVPSRYALKIGEIDVLVVSDGVLPLPTTMLAHNADPAVRATWLHDMFLPQDAFDWALNAVMVRSGGKTILIDAGLGSDPNLNLPRAGQLIKRLAAAGIDLSSVTDLVLTHLHMDHIGGLLVNGVKEQLRKDLRIHVAAAEVKFWEAPDFSRTAMPEGFPDALRATAKRFVKEFGPRLRLFDDEHEVAPGVIARRTGGHTPGHSVVRMASGDDALTFAGEPCLPSGSNNRTGTTVSNTTPRMRRAYASISCESSPRPARCWWPRTCRSRPWAGSRSTATPFVGFRCSGTTERLPD